MPAKRLKLTASDVAVLHTDAFQVVMEYLAPRELFRLAFCSKELMNSVTTKMVVRSALLHGGHAKSQKHNKKDCSTHEETLHLCSYAAVFVALSQRQTVRATTVRGLLWKKCQSRTKIREFLLFGV